MNVAILHGWRQEGMPVGASLLAKILRAPRGVRLPALSLKTIASELAPTMGVFQIQMASHSG
ncbi:hypothetical protein PS914_00885 [Pseudomonas fluorescens]|uniref:Uncharacterized protein n=1 Tax=Pseudomonas fluorescens TaxID=294 RepID=A0A5E7CMH2_PSEFL|nr:hypothetical protein PS833_03056 [Pseudomonas fluorescens]VVP69929.1 hypothetical protein PS914_00885 [Pseudomonas fluorescens]